MANEKNPAQRLLRRSTRVYLYQIMVATAPILVGVGMITEGLAQQLLALLGAALTVGGGALALKNVSGD